MNIVFTGHRNCITASKYLSELQAKYPGARWIHGGAVGFDTQVDEFALLHGITVEKVRPDYKAYHPKVAPIMRNHQMVDKADLVIACWDGRETGGTWDTIKYARAKRVSIAMAPCVPLPSFVRVPLSI